jgi:hypothetical protein
LIGFIYRLNILGDQFENSKGVKDSGLKATFPLPGIPKLYFGFELRSPGGTEGKRELWKKLNSSSHSGHALQIVRDFMYATSVPLGVPKIDGRFEDPGGVKEGSLGDLYSPGIPKPVFLNC